MVYGPDPGTIFLTLDGGGSDVAPNSFPGPRFETLYQCSLSEPVPVKTLHLGRVSWALFLASLAGHDCV